ncbi:MAG: hypothetical protein GX053_02465 [Tissierella sp.]|nr:hypothetical protein [Tissierella sp.]
MSGLFNLGSLLLGLIAWIVPILAMKYHKKNEIKHCFYFIIVSFSACIASLCLQLFEVNHRVQIKDWSALMDTMGTLIWVAVILASVTLIVNIMALFICSKKEMKD